MADHQSEIVLESLRGTPANGGIVDDAFGADGSSPTHDVALASYLSRQSPHSSLLHHGASSSATGNKNRRTPARGAVPVSPVVIPASTDRPLPRVGATTPTTAAHRSWNGTSVASGGNTLVGGGGAVIRHNSSFNGTAPPVAASGGIGTSRSGMPAFAVTPPVPGNSTVPSAAASKAAGQTNNTSFVSSLGSSKSPGSPAGQPAQSSQNVTPHPSASRVSVAAGARTRQIAKEVERHRQNAARWCCYTTQGLQVFFIAAAVVCVCLSGVTMALTWGSTSIDSEAAAAASLSAAHAYRTQLSAAALRANADRLNTASLLPLALARSNSFSAAMGAGWNRTVTASQWAQICANAANAFVSTMATAAPPLKSAVEPSRLSIFVSTFDQVSTLAAGAPSVAAAASTVAAAYLSNAVNMAVASIYVDTASQQFSTISNDPTTDTRFCSTMLDASELSAVASSALAAADAAATLSTSGAPACTARLAARLIAASLVNAFDSTNFGNGGAWPSPAAVQAALPKSFVFSSSSNVTNGTTVNSRLLAAASLIVNAASVSTPLIVTIMYESLLVADSLSSDALLPVWPPTTSYAAWDDAILVRGAVCVAPTAALIASSGSLATLSNCVGVSPTASGPPSYQVWVNGLGPDDLTSLGFSRGSSGSPAFGVTDNINRIVSSAKANTTWSWTFGAGPSTVVMVSPTGTSDITAVTWSVVPLPLMSGTVAATSRRAFVGVAISIERIVRPLSWQSPDVGRSLIAVATIVTSVLFAIAACLAVGWLITPIRRLRSIVTFDLTMEELRDRGSPTIGDLAEVEELEEALMRLQLDVTTLEAFIPENGGALNSFSIGSRPPAAQREAKGSLRVTPTTVRVLGVRMGDVPSMAFATLSDRPISPRPHESDSDNEHELMSNLSSISQSSTASQSSTRQSSTNSLGELKISRSGNLGSAVVTPTVPAPSTAGNSEGGAVTSAAVAIAPSPAAAVATMPPAAPHVVVPAAERLINEVHSIDGIVVVLSSRNRGSSSFGHSATRPSSRMATPCANPLAPSSHHGGPNAAGPALHMELASQEFLRAAVTEVGRCGGTVASMTPRAVICYWTPAMTTSKGFSTVSAQNSGGPVGPSRVDPSQTIARSACDAALTFVKRMNQRRAECDLSCVSFGVGVARGDFQRGVFGLTSKKSYVCEGPCVSMATALSELALLLHAKIVVSESVQRLCSSSTTIVMRPVDEVVTWTRHQPLIPYRQNARQLQGSLTMGNSAELWTGASSSPSQRGAAAAAAGVTRQSSALGGSSQPLRLSSGLIASTNAMHHHPSIDGDVVYEVLPPPTWIAENPALWSGHHSTARDALAISPSVVSTGAVFELPAAPNNPTGVQQRQLVAGGGSEEWMYVLQRVEACQQQMLRFNELGFAAWRLGDLAAAKWHYAMAYDVKRQRGEHDAFLAKRLKLLHHVPWVDIPASTPPSSLLTSPNAGRPSNAGRAPSPSTTGEAAKDAAAPTLPPSVAALMHDVAGNARSSHASAVLVRLAAESSVDLAHSTTGAASGGGALAVDSTFDVQTPSVVRSGTSWYVRRVLPNGALETMPWDYV